VADASQRELATASGISRSVIDRIESGAVEPRVAQLCTLLGLVGWHLGVMDETGGLQSALDHLTHPWRDGGERHYPAHLDLIVSPERGEWWGDWLGYQSPPETYQLDRAARDVRRAQSQWDLKRGPYRARPNVPRPTWGPDSVDAG
jgi:transcriptional regulator with XRE-family HTH domain